MPIKSLHNKRFMLRFTIISDEALILSSEIVMTSTKVGNLKKINIQLQFKMDIDCEIQRNHGFSRLKHDIKQLFISRMV